jgi:hypothetical protein
LHDVRVAEAGERLGLAEEHRLVVPGVHLDRDELPEEPVAAEVHARLAALAERRRDPVLVVEESSLSRSMRLKTRVAIWASRAGSFKSSTKRSPRRIHPPGAPS